MLEKCWCLKDPVEGGSEVISYFALSVQQVQMSDWAQFLLFISEEFCVHGTTAPVPC